MTIERVVCWDESAQGWYDTETDTRIENLTPDNALEPTKIPYFNAVTYEQVQAMIDDAFRRRIAGGSNMHYFVDDNLIVPLGYYRQLSNRIQSLHERLFAIEHKRPWYKRW